jgi:proteasome assembly chaperone (PAC2) family protein
MDASSARELRDLTDPIVVAAFEGWNDAGSAASAAVDHLTETCDAELAFALDPDDFYDFQVNRPQVELTEEGDRRLLWPTTELYIGRLRSGRDLLLVRGPEPNMRWRQFSALLASALTSAHATRVHLLGALLADIPHTRPIPVSTSSSSAELGEQLRLLPSTYEGPSGIVGVLADALGRIGIPTVSLWAAVPAYVAHPPCPKATVALLSQLERLVDASFDLGDLPDLAKAWERGVDELAAEDSEVADYVSNLEASQDATELPEASGEAIAAEFERYLRRRQGG